MKTKLLAIFLVAASYVQAQFGSQQVISSTLNLANHAIPFDVNNDDFVDIVACSLSGNKIVWHQNLDGLGNFGDEQIISEDVNTLLEMELADIDNDGLKDIVYNTNQNDKLAWIKNVDGLGNFGSEQVISQEPHAYTFTISDLDNDGDQDIVAILFNGNFGDIMVWFENTDGLGNYSDQIIIEDEIFSEFSQISIIDIDQDGDNDIVTGYERFQNTGEVVLYKNLNGTGTFEERQSIFSFTGFSDNTSIGYVIPTDVNGDGFVDIIFDTGNADTDDYIYWIEHLDGLANFGSQQLIHVKETHLSAISTPDLDGDGDYDLLVSFYAQPHSSLAWFENTNGAGDFGPKQTITTEVDRATDANAADLNGDGELDVISSSSFDDKIAWYEYGGDLSLLDKATNSFSVTPNPSTGIFKVNSETNVAQIEVYNSIGQIVLMVENPEIIDLNSSPQGIYLLKITGEDKTISHKKVMKY